MGTDLDLQLAWAGRNRFAKEKVTPVILKPRSDKSAPGPGDDRNMVIEGNNLDVMAALLASNSFAHLRGGIDLMLWDPPYNTGKKAAKGKTAISKGRGSKFRYNDDFLLTTQEIQDLKRANPAGWDIVQDTDPSKHSKWLSFMEARFRMAERLLKPSGVIAVHIDDIEMFRLGVLMDEVFGEENRIAIINWQKQHSPKNDSAHVATTTEYILVYAKKKSEAETILLSRTASVNAAYKQRDGDSRPWSGVDPVAKTADAAGRYALQSPFTGALHYPGSGAWRHPKAHMKQWLEEWGVNYIERDLKDGRPKALVLAGAPRFTVDSDLDLDTDHIQTPTDIEVHPVILRAMAAANERLARPWPKLFFRQDKDRVPGGGRPRIKSYLEDVKDGLVPTTWWSNEHYEEPLAIGSAAWSHEHADHTQAARSELDSIMGRNHGFETIKPVKLLKKIIQLWCPPNGIVLDVFGGSGSTAHAVLELNQEGAGEGGTPDRSFILIERGEGEDRYADSLTAERVRRVISGCWASGKRSGLPGGFEFLTSLSEKGVPLKVGRKAILAWTREQLIDAILQSLDTTGKSDCKVSSPGGYVIGRTRKGNAVALVWDGVNEVDDAKLDDILSEAEQLNLKTPVFIYTKHNRARYDENDWRFCPIPDRILASLGVTNEEDE